MSARTTVAQRQTFFQRHQAGQTYAQIAADTGVSPECVRYWCRRQRDGGDVHTRYGRDTPGLLARFDPKVRLVVLRLRLAHPRWGPNRILHKMRKRPSLVGLCLPSQAQIGRYLHQWPRFRRQKPPKKKSSRPRQATRVHQRWQLDFKVGIVLKDGTQVNLHTVRDPVAEACVGAAVYPAGPTGQAPKRVKLPEVRATLQQCFVRWGTLPQEVQTDHEPGLLGSQPGGFPALLTLWLVGLGIEHVLIRPGRPTDNAEVERCHRTLCDYVLTGNAQADRQTLQTTLDTAVTELAYELTSRAEGCAGRPPVAAHPELLDQPRPFRPEWGLACFSMERVDAYLSTFTWERIVGETGQAYIADHRYSVGKKHARKQVLVRFDPMDRQLVFYDRQGPHSEIKRQPIRGLEIADLTGLCSDANPANQIPQQLPLPLVWIPSKGYIVKEHMEV